LKLKDLRSCIGLVSQDVFYFMALWRRILPTEFSAAPSEVIAAAKIAEAHDFVIQLPKAMRRLWESAVRNYWWATAVDRTRR